MNREEIIIDETISSDEFYRVSAQFLKGELTNEQFIKEIGYLHDSYTVKVYQRCPEDCMDVAKAEKERKAV